MHQNGKFSAASLKATHKEFLVTAPRWMAHFWAVCANGEAHEWEHGPRHGWAVYINAKDVKLFPELRDYYEVRLGYDNETNTMIAVLVPEPPHEAT